MAAQRWLGAGQPVPAAVDAGKVEQITNWLGDRDRQAGRNARTRLAARGEEAE